MSEHVKEKILYGARVEFHNKGLWPEEALLHFEDGDSTVLGKSDSNAGNTMQVYSIDDVISEQVSFIKMDIEGAEVEALKGAHKVITRDKPCMAICIYHKPSDLWEVPLLIHEMVPEYKFYVKHCGASMYGTILYVRL